MSDAEVHFLSVFLLCVGIVFAAGLIATGIESGLNKLGQRIKEGLEKMEGA